MRKKEVNLLEQSSVWRMITQLIIPSVIITLVMVIYNMADIFFIGKTGNSDMVNAISVCMPLFTVIQAFGTLIGSGGCTAISIALGKGDTNRTKKISVFCCYAALFLGVILTAVLNLFAKPIINLLGGESISSDYVETYLRVIAVGAPVMLFSNAMVNVIRADGSAKESMKANLLGTFTNIFLDPLFILVLGWGVGGAAAATVFGNLVSMIYVVLFIRKKKGFLSLSLKKFTIKFDISLGTLRLGVPLAVGTLLLSFSYIVMNQLLIGYDANATGAFGICRTIMLLSTMIHIGISMGVQPAVSFCYGEGNYSRMKEIVLKTTIIALLFGIIVSILCIFGKNLILNAFTNDEKIIYYGRKMIVGYLCTSAVYGVFQISTSFLQATEKPMSGTIVTLLRQGIALVPVVLLLNSLFGIDGLVFAFAVTDVIAAAVGALTAKKRLSRIMS